MHHYDFPFTNKYYNLANRMTCYIVPEDKFDIFILHTILFLKLFDDKTSDKHAICYRLNDELKKNARMLKLLIEG